LEVEEILRWILDAAKDDKADMDDIPIAGQHRMSVRTLLAPPPSARISKKCEHQCNDRSHDGEPILQFFKALPPSLD
jgi:hypothetical protein